MKKTLFALLALVALLVGCPSNAPTPQVDASAFEAGTAVDASIDGASHRVGSFTPSVGVSGTVQTSNGSAGLSGATNVLAGANYVSIGATPALTGTLQLPNASTGKARNAGNTADLVVWQTDASNFLWLGADNAQANAFAQVGIYPSTTLALGAGGSTYLYLTGGNNEAWKPITGSASGSSPYSVHGLSTSIALSTGASSTLVLTAAQYKNQTLQFSGALTANQTVTVPGAADAAAYYKEIDNLCTGALAVIVNASAGASTVTIPNGTRARVLIDSRGVTLPSQAVSTIAAGSAPAQSGDIRLSNNSSIKGRYSGNNGDQAIIGINASNGIFIGDTTNGIVDLYGYSGGYFATTFGSTRAMIVNATSLSPGVPIIGDSGGNSPYSVHGKITDATAGAFTVTAATYQYDIIQLTGGTAATVTFPLPTSDARAYYKTLINTSGVTKTIAAGAAATTQPFNTGNTARFMFDSGGVHLAAASTAYP